MKKLVVVESPSKVKSIKKYLGKGYDVAASMGHIVDLPKSDLGVDTEKDFSPKYTVTKRKALTKLKKEFEGKDVLVIATDPDREGEAIGWHVAQRLGVVSKRGKVKSKGLERIVFTEITESAVKKAAKSPRGIDMDLVDAQQTRRILDRLVGYKLSPLLWKKIRFGLSAGRVQSVAVKLIVDRERERDAFNPEEFWNIRAYLIEAEGKKFKILIENKEEIDKKKKYNGIAFKLVKIKDRKSHVPSRKEVEVILEAIEDKDWKIERIEEKEVTRNPSPPFSTSTLQQTASNKLGYGAKRTMQIAQKLYEAGLITYMRTDSISMSAQAVKAARKVIEGTYGKEYIPEKPKFYKTKAKVAQEAHEAIRPTDFGLKEVGGKLKDDYQKLYSLIRKRALSSQANAAKLKSKKVFIEIADYLFEADGLSVVFDGFMAIWGNGFKEAILPDLKVGQNLYIETLLAQQKFTEPPARYSEATLIKALEKEGIGRPSTYAAIISTIQARKYVEKEGKYFFPTDTGEVVTRLLEDNFENVVDLGFTATMEDSLDDVASGKKEWKKVIAEFYGPFEKNLESKEKDIDRAKYTVLGDAPDDISCPECKGKMEIKLGRYGRFYSCKKFPDCKGVLDKSGRSEEDRQKEVKGKEFLSKYLPAPKTDDDRDYLLKSGRFGDFWAHPDYPKVKDAKALEFTKEIFKELYGNPPKAKDGKKMVLRRGRFGEFWAHPNYPKVKEVSRIDKKKLKEKKQDLGLS